MKLYKLTAKDGTTYKNSTSWGEGITHTKSHKDNPRLCSIDVLHAYDSLSLAFLLNPIHADITQPRVFEAEGDVAARDWGKVGCFQLTTTKEISPPWWVGHAMEKQVRVLFAALCAEQVEPLYAAEFPGDRSVKEVVEAIKSMALSGDFSPAAYAAEGAYMAAKAAKAAYMAAYAAEGAYIAAKAAEAAYAAAQAAHAAAQGAMEEEAARAARAAADAKSPTTSFSSIADRAPEVLRTQMNQP